MHWSFRLVTVNKRYPLTISRGTQSRGDNLFVSVSDGCLTGVGELSPGRTADWTGLKAQAQIESVVCPFEDNLSIVEAWTRMRAAELDPPAVAAVDMALWDLFGKQCGQPLHRVFGLSKPSVPTSVTIGINPVEVIRERVPEILARTGARRLKVKLGAPEGLERDRENYAAAWEASMPYGVTVQVDANGGWSVDDTVKMMRWLAERGAKYVEQPLAEGQEADLPALFEGRVLPIFLDESIRFSSDVAKYAHCCDGVNLKLMKCGGLTEAVRVVAAARSHGLQTMIGCMSETSIAISAAAQIGALFDYVDLDSHLNLAPDPASGAMMIDGIIIPSDAPGHGASLKDADATT